MLPACWLLVDVNIFVWPSSWLTPPPSSLFFSALLKWVILWDAFSLLDVRVWCPQPASIDLQELQSHLALGSAAMVTAL